MLGFHRHALEQGMKTNRGKERVEDKEKDLLKKVRKIRVVYNDPDATDYSSEEEESMFLRNENQLDGSKRIVKKMLVPCMNENKKKNEFESSLLALRKRVAILDSKDVKQVLLFQTSPSSVLDDVNIAAIKAAPDTNDNINGSVKENNIKALTSGEKGEVISNQYLLEDSNVASLAGHHDLYFLDEIEMMIGDGFCNNLDNDINIDSMWKVENSEGRSFLPPVDCYFDDLELGWIDETLNWDCH